MTKIIPAILGEFMDTTIYVIQKDTGITTDLNVAIEEEEQKIEKTETAEIKTSDVSHTETSSEIDRVTEPIIHGILILVNDAEHDFADDASKILLRNILTAVDLNFKLIHAKNIAKLEDSEAYLKENSGEKIILFGESTLSAFPHISRKYELIKDKESTILYADSLKDLCEDVSKKKKLWASLQILFKK